MGQKDWRRQCVGRWVLLAEFVVLFVGVPLTVFVADVPGPWLMPILCASAGLTMLIAWRHRAFREAMGLGLADRLSLGRCLGVGLGVWAGIAVPVLAYHGWLGRPLVPLVWDRPGFFAALCIVYPISCTAQEFVYRGFFFWRYARLASAEGLLWLNVAAFGWVHIVYGTWVSVVLSVLAGTILAVLYLRHRSLAAIIVIHSLLGLSVFAAGYGSYFLKEPLSHEARLDHCSRNRPDLDDSRISGRDLAARPGGSLNAR